MGTDRDNREVTVRMADMGVALVGTGDDERQRRHAGSRRRRKEDQADPSAAFVDYERNGPRNLDQWQDNADALLDAEIGATSGKTSDVFDVERAIRGAVPKRCSQVEAEIIKALAVLLWRNGEHHYNQPCPRDCPACLGHGGKHLGALALSKVLRIEEPKPPLETFSNDYVRPTPPAELVEIAVDRVSGVVVGARAEIDAGSKIERTRVHAVDFEAKTITVRLEKSHGPARFAVVVHPHRTPFKSVDDAMVYLAGSFELGRGASGGWKRDERGELAMTIAEDRDEDRALRAYAEQRGRLPSVTRAREKTGTLTRYLSAGGYLPRNFLPAKQSSNGKLGGARNETQLELQGDVERLFVDALSGVRFTALDRELARWVMTMRGFDGALEVAIEEQKRLREQARVYPASLGSMSDEDRGLALAGDVTEEDLRDRMGRIKRALAEAFARRGLIPPREPRKPRKKAATRSMLEIEPMQSPRMMGGLL